MGSGYISRLDLDVYEGRSWISIKVGSVYLSRPDLDHAHNRILIPVDMTRSRIPVSGSYNGSDPNPDSLSKCSESLKLVACTVYTMDIRLLKVF